MKKDLKEAILGIEVTQFDGQKADLEELVNPKQLEKIISDWMPEVLSREFINEKAVEIYADTADAEVHAVFRIRDLQNLFVPKQEKPIVPQHVADWFEEMSLLTTLSYVLGELNKAYGNNQKMYKWVKTLTGPSPNDLANAQEIIARMFLDGYEIEEEPKYRVSAPNRESGFWFLSKNNENEVEVGTNEDYFNANWGAIELTEQEIKDYDERYFAFAVQVEELEE